MTIKIGARWDDEIQNERICKAKMLGLTDYIEVNYPIAAHENPYCCELPIYAHSAYNGLCSAFGLNERLAHSIKAEADKYNSPWIGEHLSWISPTQDKALGYVYNTFYTEEFKTVTIQNIQKLQRIYQRSVALELGPHYSLADNDFNEIDFHISIANETNSFLILDLTHLIISNNNLGRQLDFGLDKYVNAPVIEIHLAGYRNSLNSIYWHDCHDNLPDSFVLNLARNFSKSCKALKAVTFEYASGASEYDFLKGLENIKESLSL